MRNVAQSDREQRHPEGPTVCDDAAALQQHTDPVESICYPNMVMTSKIDYYGGSHGLLVTLRRTGCSCRLLEISVFEFSKRMFLLRDKKNAAVDLAIVSRMYYNPRTRSFANN